MRWHAVWLLVICLVAPFTRLDAAEPPAATKDKLLLLKLSNLTAASPSADMKRLQQALLRTTGVTHVTLETKKGELRIAHKANAVIGAIRRAVTANGFVIVDPKPYPGDPAPPLREARR